MRLHPFSKMKRLLILPLIFLVACASLADLETDSAMKSISLPDYGPAPEFVNSVWLNTDGPLTLADLRGKVVAVDMWTFG